MSPRERPRKAAARQKKPASRKASARQQPVRKEPARRARQGRAVQPTPPPQAGGPTRTGSVVDQLGPRLREEFGYLQKQESKILKALEDPETRRHYLTDPGGALERMGVQVPPTLKKRLKPQPGLPDFVTPRRFRLPNGQVVTAKVNVRFTSKGGRHGR